MERAAVEFHGDSRGIVVHVEHVGASTRSHRVLSVKRAEFRGVEDPGGSEVFEIALRPIVERIEERDERATCSNPGVGGGAHAEGVGRDPFASHGIEDQCRAATCPEFAPRLDHRVQRRHHAEAACVRPCHVDRRLDHSNPLGATEASGSRNTQSDRGRFLRDEAVSKRGRGATERGCGPGPHEGGCGPGRERIPVGGADVGVRQDVSDESQANVAVERVTREVREDVGATDGSRFAGEPLGGRRVGASLGSSLSGHSSPEGPVAPLRQEPSRAQSTRWPWGS